MKQELNLVSGSRQPADVVFLNGVVVTVNRQNDIQEAVAIKENKIAYVGKNDLAETWIKEGHTKVIDLQGRSLLPGFIDAHTHFMVRGLKDTSVVDGSIATSIGELLELIRENCKSKAPGEWIKLQGYDQNKLKEHRHPTIEELDEVAPDHPVQCQRCCYHMSVYNTKALEICEFSDNGTFLEEEVEKKDGKLTGLLKEDANRAMCVKITESEEELLAAARKADQLCSAVGITSVHDAGTYGMVSRRIMEEATRSGTVKTRIYTMPCELNGKVLNEKLIDEFVGTGMTSGFGNERFRIGPLKIFMDGGCTGPSCMTKEPYDHDPDLKGVLVNDQKAADKFVSKAHDARFQVTSHAAGDLGVELFINSIEKAYKSNPRKDCRHRIEHCALTDEKILNRIKELRIVPISNPGFFTSFAGAFCKYYGDRVDYMFPLKAYLEKGIITAFGTDAPVVDENPLLSIYGAVTRKDMKTGEVAGASQVIGVLDAIRMYTYNGAYASFEENIKGSIEEGKLADLVVLSENILEADVERIKDMVTDMTVIDGEIVYERV